METIGITVTGRVADEPYRGTTSTGAAMTALNLEVSVPPVSAGADPGTRWLRVVCFGILASRVADSIQAGDRVTVLDHARIHRWQARIRCALLPDHGPAGG